MFSSNNFVKTSLEILLLISPPLANDMEPRSSETIMQMASVFSVIPTAALCRSPKL